MQTVTIATSQNIDIDYEIAGLGERILARLIDFGVFIAIAVLLTNVPGSWKGESFYGMDLIWIVFLLLFMFYPLVEVSFNGQTIGKRIMKIKVISLNGARPTFGQYLMRWVFRLVDLWLTMQVGGLVCIAVSKKNQRIGDIVAGTSLIRTSSKKSRSKFSFELPSENYKPVFLDKVQHLNEHQVFLIIDVLDNYSKSRNEALIEYASSQFRELLDIKDTRRLDDLMLLETLIHDYNFQYHVSEEVHGD